MSAARFVTDSSLDHLARRLRFLGYDIATHRGARLEELFEVAAREGRAVLTRSPRHPRRWAKVPRVTVDGADTAAALRDLAARFEPAGAPFSRCPDCNAALQRRHVMEARGEVPGRVLRSFPALAHCPHCGKWYWEGSHVARIRAWLEATLGRPLDAGPPSAPPPGSLTEPPRG